MGCRKVAWSVESGTGSGFHRIMDGKIAGSGMLAIGKRRCYNGLR